MEPPGASRQRRRETVRALRRAAAALFGGLFDAAGVARDGKPYENTYAWFPVRRSVELERPKARQGRRAPPLRRFPCQREVLDRLAQTHSDMALVERDLAADPIPQLTPETVAGIRGERSRRTNSGPESSPTG